MRAKRPYSQCIQQAQHGGVEPEGTAKVNIKGLCMHWCTDRASSGSAVNTHTSKNAATTATRPFQLPAGGSRVLCDSRIAPRLIVPFSIGTSVSIANRRPWARCLLTFIKKLTATWPRDTISTATLSADITEAVCFAAGKIFASRCKPRFKNGFSPI